MYRVLPNTLPSVRVHQQVRTKEYQCWTIYHITYDNDSSHTNISETNTLCRQRFKEHTHQEEWEITAGPQDTQCPWRTPKVVTWELNWHKRKVTEAIHIKQPSGWCVKHSYDIMWMISDDWYLKGSYGVVTMAQSLRWQCSLCASALRDTLVARVSNSAPVVAA